MPGNNVRVGVGVAGAKQASSELDKFRDKFTALQKTSAKGFAIGAGVAATNLAFNSVGMAIRGVTGFLGDATDAFQEDQVSVQKLTTSLRANATAWDGTSDAIDERIKAGQALGFSDEDQRSSLAELVGAYGDVTKSLDVMRTAMDLARYSGVDLGTASDTLIKVHAGNYRALKALGINTTNIKNETQALAAVMKVAGGQAADFASTDLGKLIVAEEKSAEQSERFGAALSKVVAPAKELGAGILEGVADAIDQVTDAEAQYDAHGASNFNAHLYDINPLGHAAADAAAAAAAAVAGFTDEAKDARQPGKGLAGVLHDIGYEADKTEQAIDDLSDTIAEELFGDAINEGNLADLQATRDELVKQREEATKGSAEYKILTGRIAETDQAMFELQLTMAEEEGPAAVISFLDKAKTKYGQNNEKLRAMIANLERVWGLLNRFDDVGAISFGWRYAGKMAPEGARASGGPVTGGHAYTVGERGPETFVPKQSGTIIPNGATGSSLTVNFNLVYPPTQAQMREITSMVSREQQRLGLLPRAGAF